MAKLTPEERKARAKERQAQRRKVKEAERLRDDADATGGTEERAAKSVITGGKRLGLGKGAGYARTNADLPSTIVKLFQRGQLELRHVRAAERYRSDYLFGVCSSGMTQKFEKGVDGSRGGNVGERRAIARDQWINADKVLGPTRQTVFAVLISGVTLEALDGPGRVYASLGARRAGNHAGLYLGLNALAEFYEIS